MSSLSFASLSKSVVATALPVGMMAYFGGVPGGMVDPLIRGAALGAVNYLSSHVFQGILGNAQKNNLYLNVIVSFGVTVFAGLALFESPMLMLAGLTGALFYHLMTPHVAKSKVPPIGTITKDDDAKTQRFSPITKQTLLNCEKSANFPFPIEPKDHLAKVESLICLSDMISSKPSEWVPRHVADTLLGCVVPQENLVSNEGEIKKKGNGFSIGAHPYLIAEHIVTNTIPELQVPFARLMRGLITKEGGLPKRTLVPFAVMNAKHVAGLCIEIDEKKRRIEITGIDSMGNHCEMASKGPLMMKEVLESQPQYNNYAIETTSTQYNQNNLLKCGYHVILNLLAAARAKNSVYLDVKTSVEMNQYSALFPLVNKEEMFQAMKTLRNAALKKAAEFFEANRGNITMGGVPYCPDLTTDPVPEWNDIKNYFN